jgi:predicted AAA+ superfamily ATPase
MQRYLDARIRTDLAKKMVILTGPRQVGKTTLSQQLLAENRGALYLNYDVPEHRETLIRQSWDKKAPLLVFDEIHKMPQWKPWLKGVFDGRTLSTAPGQNQVLQAQQLLVTGSARMDTFRQTGESLAGRYYQLRLHPISVREWCEQTGAAPDAALTHLLQRGGFPEPCLASDDMEAQRWRKDYFQSLVREDVLEFSRLQEVNAMRVFAQALRSRVGSPLSIASISRDMGVSPKTLDKYLDILQALFIVFVVRPWHRNVTRATLQQPKVYFFDTGLVQGDDGVRFENLVACHLLKHVHWQQDAKGKDADLHYLRTKDGAEVDFCLSDATNGEPTLTHLVECKLTDAKPHRALGRFAAQWPDAEALQVLRDLRTAQDFGGIKIRAAAQWLTTLET